MAPHTLTKWALGEIRCSPLTKDPHFSHMQCCLKHQNSHAGRIYFLPQLMFPFLRGITLTFHLFLKEGSNYCPYYHCSFKNLTCKMLLLPFVLLSRWNYGDSCPVLTGMVSSVSRKRSHSAQAFRFHLGFPCLEEMAVSVCSQLPIIPFCREVFTNKKDFSVNLVAK